MIASRRFLPLLLLSTTLFCSCINEPALKSPFKDFTAADLDDGWELSSPERESIDSVALRDVFADVHADDASWQLRSMTVIRNGHLIGESYMKDVHDRVTPRAIWSCTKQVMGILTGIALDQGLISSLDDPIARYLPIIETRYPDKKGITIKDLLMMRSGIGYENYGISGDDSSIMQGIPGNYLEFILEKPMLTAPGTEFEYKDSDPQLLVAVLESVIGRPLDEWAEEVLFRPIGMTRYSWKRYRDGHTLGSFGIMTTPRELGKIAQLVLNGGTLGDRRIVSEEWVAAMVSPMTKAADKHFGYLWWSYPEAGTYFMSGNGRQIAFVFPSSKLIVVFTSETNVQGKFNLNTLLALRYAERIHALCR